MKSKKDTQEILDTLKKEYPNSKGSLSFETPFQLLVAVCLSAQCTDDRVNMVTKELFKVASTPSDFDKLDINKLEELIHSCGFYKNKAKNLKAAAKKILDDFDGEVPNDIDKLVTIPGVGRKSANVIMLDAFNNPQGIAVDTHVGRLSTRIGFSKEKEPIKIEQDLLKQIPKDEYYMVNHTFIDHGRLICKSQKPKCDLCKIKHLCNYGKKTK